MAMMTKNEDDDDDNDDDKINLHGVDVSRVKLLHKPHLAKGTLHQKP